MTRQHRILMTLRIIALILVVLAFLIYRARAAAPPAQLQAQSNFRIETTLDEKVPTFTVTNLSSKTLTAAHFRFSSSARHAPMSEMSWDPLWQGSDGSQPLSPGPLLPGTSMTMYLPHGVDAPPTDQVEILAGIWADGETFGDLSKLKVVVNHRVPLASSYEQTIAIVQRGLDENWNRTQYLQALRVAPNSPALRFVMIAFRPYKIPDADTTSLKPAMQSVLEALKHNLDMLRPAKPSPATPQS
jgi:hypothetical protein